MRLEYETSTTLVSLPDPQYTGSVLAHSVMLYYIFQTLLLPNWGSGYETSTTSVSWLCHTCGIASLPASLPFMFDSKGFQEYQVISKFKVLWKKNCNNNNSSNCNNNNCNNNSSCNNNSNNRDPWSTWSEPGGFASHSHYHKTIHLLQDLNQLTSELRGHLWPSCMLWPIVKHSSHMPDVFICWSLNPRALPYCELHGPLIRN